MSSPLAFVVKALANSVINLLTSSIFFSIFSTSFWYAFINSLNVAISKYLDGSNIFSFFIPDKASKAALKAITVAFTDSNFLTKKLRSFEFLFPMSLALSNDSFILFIIAEFKLTLLLSS